MRYFILRLIIILTFLAIAGYFTALDANKNYAKHIKSQEQSRTNSAERALATEHLKFSSQVGH